VAVEGGLERLDLTCELLVVGFQLAVVTHKLVELAANPVGVAAGVPGFLAALVDKGGAMLLLLFGGERHIDRFSIAQQEIARGESEEAEDCQGSAYLES
jgi:hypothetical protein